MANEEVLGSRKTMFVLVIVVGCFAVLWPRILSPIMMGQGQLKPNQFDRDADMKQERSPIRGAGPHPALRERGRAIPAGAPTPPSRGPVPMPPHARVRSPLSVYFETEVIKPPPIPGMRPPLGSPGGPVAAPKSSMGFVMPIYTICIIVFFVYTLSKILFKRTGSIPYEHVAPDPQFRRRVFRDDSRSSPDTKLGPKERDAIVTAISGLVAEVHQQMEANYAQSQQRQEAQENQTNGRPYTNGSVVKSSPIIIATEYVDQKEKSPEPEKVKEASPEPEKVKEASPEPKEPSSEKEPSPEPSPEKRFSPEPSPEKEFSPVPSPEKELSPEKESSPEEELSPKKESSPEEELSPEKEFSPEKEQFLEINKSNEASLINEDLFKLTEDIKEKKENLAKSTEEFLNDARQKEEKTAELLKEALKEDLLDDEGEEEEEEEEEEEDDEPEPENVSVKVVGMELTAHTASGSRPRPAPPAPSPPAAPNKSHEADEVKSIFLETRIPQQSRVLVAEFEDKTKPAKSEPARKHEPMVVSGKMTLSLIQDAPRDTPERDPESTVDDFTTASAMTQPAAEKEGESSDEELEEEIEIEEIEEEEEEEPEPKKTQK